MDAWGTNTEEPLFIMHRRDAMPQDESRQSRPWLAPVLKALTPPCSFLLKEVQDGKTCQTLAILPERTRTK